MFRARAPRIDVRAGVLRCKSIDLDATDWPNQAVHSAEAGCIRGKPESTLSPLMPGKSNVSSARAANRPARWGFALQIDRYRCYRLGKPNLSLGGW